MLVEWTPANSKVIQSEDDEDKSAFHIKKSFSTTKNEVLRKDNDDDNDDVEAPTQSRNGSDLL